MKKGTHQTELAKKKIGLNGFHFGMLGKNHTDKTKEKIGIKHIGNTNGFKKGGVPWNKGMKGYQSGNKHYNWRGGSGDRHKGQEYDYWRSEVYKRDGFKCKIADENCKGKIEAHHILGWEEYPELRLNINNGITVCHYHHPRKKGDEIKLIQTFTGLVMQKN
jgi:hypothetical protein